MCAHIKDFTGQRFGKLVVLKMLDERKNNIIMYECQCDCGNTVAVSRKYLSRSLSSASCGCNWKKNNWPKDITGLRFGRLTVLRPTEKRKRYSVVWECRCDCGNITYVSRDHLVSGNTSSCGCLYKEIIHTLDLTGQRFGRLVAIRSLEERKNSNIVWECQCDCGNITHVQANNLNFGSILSCGCLQKEIVSGITSKDLTGQRFGNLTALTPTSKRKRNYVVWECKCDCGKIIEASTEELRRGTASSCGCMKKSKQSKKK